MIGYNEGNWRMGCGIRHGISQTENRLTVSPSQQFDYSFLRTMRIPDHITIGALADSGVSVSF